VLFRRSKLAFALVTGFYTFIPSSGLRRAGTRRPWPLRYSDLSCSA
jgi:hypothetical protein